MSRYFLPFTGIAICSRLRARAQVISRMGANQSSRTRTEQAGEGTRSPGPNQSCTIAPPPRTKIEIENVIWNGFCFFSMLGIFGLSWFSIVRVSYFSIFRFLAFLLYKCFLRFVAVLSPVDKDYCPLWVESMGLALLPLGEEQSIASQN